MNDILFIKFEIIGNIKLVVIVGWFVRMMELSFIIIDLGISEMIQSKRFFDFIDGCIEWEI